MSFKCIILADSLFCKSFNYLICKIINYICKICVSIRLIFHITINITEQIFSICHFRFSIKISFTFINILTINTIFGLFT